MYIGLDLGTSGVKALLMDAEQRIIGSANASISVSRPQAGWSEQHPQEWVGACDQAMEHLRGRFPREFAATESISLSGQMHGATLLDSRGEVIRPCILWNDTRSHVEAAELDANPLFRQLSGNIVFPGFTAPKLCWVAKHEPENYARVAQVLLPKDYLRFWLTGDYVSEMSDAAGTSWLDVAKRDWSPELLAASGMRTEQMPRLVEGSEVSGELRAELCSRWGFVKVPKVGGGAGDNAASAIGMGVVREGQAFLSLGTSGVLFAATAGYKPKAESAVHAFCHAIPNTWHQMGVILSATDALNWYARIAGKDAAVLTAALDDKPKGPTSVRFVPYLSGERTPHNDARVRGSFIGLEHQSDQASLTQAVLEGVSFAIRDNLEALKSAGTELKSVVAVGGGSGSKFWLQTLANTLDLPVELPRDGDFGAAFGAARLAQLAVTDSDPLELLKTPVIDAVFEPTNQSAYQEAYRHYKRIYPAVRDLSLSAPG